jgi:flagellar hook-length control protein FliK
VRFSADNEATRAMIADAQPQLVAEARAQGMRIADTQVDLSSPGGSSGGAPQGGAGGTFAQQQNQPQHQQTSQQPQRQFERAAMTRPAPARPAASTTNAERYA